MKSFQDFLKGRLPKSATVAVFNNNKLLLLRRSSTAPWMPLHYALTGGGIEEGETPEDAASREMIEEIGLDIPPYELKKVQTRVENDHVNFVHATVVDNPKITLNFEHDKYEWCDYEDCKKLNLVPNLDIIIDNLKNKGYFG
jgi:8-oxo-dGTP pyrophosphatase MutT (NUDIX family)